VTIFARLAAATALSCLAAMAGAQGAPMAFGRMQSDRSLPVEVTSDSLSINQADNSAVFTGSVVIAQGGMRLSAPRVRVVYLADRSGIESLGDVLLVQGDNAITGDTVIVDTRAGTARVTGRVKTVLQPGAEK
jgi:lipopolysaccharide export system protein LptA